MEAFMLRLSCKKQIQNIHVLDIIIICPFLYTVFTFPLITLTVNGQLPAYGQLVSAPPGVNACIAHSKLANICLHFIHKQVNDQTYPKLL